MSHKPNQEILQIINSPEFFKRVENLIAVTGMLHVKDSPEFVAGLLVGIEASLQEISEWFNK